MVAPDYKKNFGKDKDKKISLILQTALSSPGGPAATRPADFAERRVTGGTAMEERMTLRSHLDRSASRTPQGSATAAVIAAIATAAIDLSAVIADGPLGGITGANGGVNPDGDQQKDIDLAADAMM